MTYILLIVSSALFYFLAYRQWKKNWTDLKSTNEKEPASWKRALNYPYHLVWPFYLFTLATGLIVNNLIIR